MAEINHRVGIGAAASEVYKALTTDEGLSTWWTTDTTGAGDVGSIIRFRFNGGGPDFEVAELQQDARVRWRHSGDYRCCSLVTPIKRCDIGCPFERQ